MGPLGELGALFNPGMRHEIEERQSKANRREEEGNARDGDLRIDLASGVAVINIPGKADGQSKSEPKTNDANGAKDDQPAAEPTAKPSRQGGSSAASRRTSSAARSSGSTARSSTGRGSSMPGERGESPSTPEKPRNGQVPSSKASRSAR